MSDPLRLALGDWEVDVSAHRLQRAGQTVALEPRAMAVLEVLSRHAGQVLSADQLMQACWPGEALGDNPVHKVITALRKALGDSARAPAYIETIRKQGYRLVAPVRVLSGHGPRGHRDTWRGRSPFRGLLAFGPEHADVFFGRDAEVAALRRRLAHQWQRGHPLAVLLGPSGCGKTSLVQAGLVPSLARAHAGHAGEADAAADAVPVLRGVTATADLGLAPEHGLFAALAGALLDWAWGDEPLLKGWSIDTLAEALARHPADVMQALQLRRVDCGLSPADGAPLLILERLEVLLQWPDTAQAGSVVDLVSGWVQARHVIVLALCRNDFYARLAAFPALMREKDHGAHFDLAPPDAEAIAQMIRLPARAAGLRFGLDPSGLNRLDDRLHADALQAADALPLLQYTLQQLHQRRTEADELTWQAYLDMGRLDGAIGQVADQTVAAWPTGQQAALSRLLPRLVGLPAEDQPPTGRWVPYADLGDPDERAAIDALVQARLLVADHQGGRPGFRVAHEALLRRWPRVTTWVAQHRGTLALRDELSPWVDRWQAAGRAGSLLLPAGDLLIRASAGLAQEPALFGDLHSRYIEESTARVRRQRRLRIAAVAGVALLAVAAAAMAVRNAQLAEVASRREAQSRELTSFMLGDLAEQLRPLGKLDLLSSVGERGLDVLGRDAAGDESPLETLQRARALVVIGEVNGGDAKRNRAVATDALNKALGLLRGLEQDGTLDSAQVLRTAARAADRLGFIDYVAGQYPSALALYRIQLDFAKRWRALHPADVDAVQAHVDALTSMGWAHGWAGDFEPSFAAWREALALQREVLALRPEDRNAQRRAVDLEAWLAGHTHFDHPKPKELAPLERAIALYRSHLSAEPANAEVQKTLTEYLWHLTYARERQGWASGAREAMDEVVRRYADVAERDPSNEFNQSVYANAAASRIRQRMRHGFDMSAEVEAWRALLDRKPTPSRDDNNWRAAMSKIVAAEAIVALQARRPDAFAQVDTLEPRLDALLGEQLRTHKAWLLAWVGVNRLQLARTRPDPGLAAYCARIVSLFGALPQAELSDERLELLWAARSCGATPRADPATSQRMTAEGHRPRLVLPPPGVAGFP